MQDFSKRKTKGTAKVLIAISITLLVYGVTLNILTTLGIVETTKISAKPKTDTPIISITPSDGNELVTDDGSDNNGSNNRVYSATDKENLALRNEIEKEFSIKVKYGKETEGYTVGGVSTVPITDSSVANKALNDLYDALSLYPVGIFKEIKNGGIPLTIILINNYSEYGVTGVTDSSYEYANISIAAIYDFNDSFFHESYHYIERYMFKKRATFNSWDTLNPGTFEWGTIDGSLSYSNTFKEDAYFVNNYAQTSAAEDRASTFEYMMAPTKASCLNNGTVVWNKANYMALTIESVFDTVSPDSIEYWERFIRD